MLRINSRMQTIKKGLTFQADFWIHIENLFMNNDIFRQVFTETHIF